MSLPRLLAYCGALLFGVIFIVAFFKDDKEVTNAPVLVKTAPVVVAAPSGNQSSTSASASSRAPVEIPLEKQPAQVAVKAKTVVKNKAPLPASLSTPVPTPPPQPALAENKPHLPSTAYPTEDRIEELFNKKGSGLKFIDTITYKSRVPWQQGRPAWLSDYATQYETSRHFIARSLNGKPDYFKQEVGEGDRFNVFKKGVDLKFHLVVDASECRMWLYAIDETHHEKTLLKTYMVCLGRPDNSKVSGLLTPLGRYTLGSRIAIYKPKVMGYHNGKKIEMVRVFGSRWIPFEKEIAQATAPAKGFGLHGVPFVDKGADGAKGELVQDKSSLGKYESDGCIRLAAEDMEEIFAIIITKPAEIEIVRNFKEASINK